MMKKIFSLITVFLLSICLISCNDKERTVYDEFINSKKTTCDFYVETDIQEAKHIVTFESIDNGFTFITNDGIDIYTYIKELNTLILFDSVNIVTYNKKTKLLPKSLGSYFSNPKFSTQKIRCDFDLKGFLVDHGFGLSSDYKQDIGMVDCEIKTNDTKVTEFSIDLSKVLSKSLLGNAKTCNLIAKNIKYGDDFSPLYTYYEFNDIYASNKDLGKLFREEIINRLAGINKDHYKLSLDNYYALKKGEELILKGQIVKNEQTIISLEECEIVFDREIDYKANVENKYTVKIIYGNFYKIANIYVTIYDETEVSDTIFLESIYIRDIFKYENYFLISDDTKLYKYNYETKEIEGEVLLKCIANSLYFKEGYLYVAANYPYSSGYLEDDAYDGTISKIDFETFTLLDQMHVDCFPYSICVDKRDKIIISKGHNQAIQYSIIDLENKTIEDIFYGYEKDCLIYNEEKDAFLSITPGLTSGNSWYFYQNGSYSSREVDSSLGVKGVSYISFDGSVIVSSKGENGFDYAKYNDDIKDYVTEFYQNDEDELNQFYSRYYITVYNDLVYHLKVKEGNKTASLVIFNIKSREYESCTMKLEGKEIVGIEVIDNKLYIAYERDQKIYIHDLNNL